MVPMKDILHKSKKHPNKESTTKQRRVEIEKKNFFSFVIWNLALRLSRSTLKWIVARNAQRADVN